MRFLAPFQNGASSSSSIFHIDLEPSHTRQSTTSYNMATPNTPITILLSHLHVLYNIIILTFVITISLFLRRRGHCCSSTTAPTGGGQRCRKRQSQRGRWPRRRLHCYTKVGSRDRGLVTERGSFALLTEVKYGALF